MQLRDAKPDNPMYQFLFRSVLVRLDPERAHGLAFSAIRFLGLPLIGSLIRRRTQPDPSLAVQTMGLHFDSPFGLAAGFDKEALGIRGLGNLGFGHVEVGTLTAQAQPGNERPRLFRLVADRAVINRMGFNNHGAAAAVGRISRVRSQRRGPIVGVNIGKSRVVDVDDAIEDYLVSARLLAPVADYLVVNVSSPNTPGLRGLQDRDKLEPLLTAVNDAAQATPVLVKISPDLADDDVAEVCHLVMDLGLAGIIATNTTVSRDGLRSTQDVVEAAGAGGLSGAPLAARALEVLTLIRSLIPQPLCVISVGGVETADDVRARLDVGATLVQGYTGFLYRGPFWARQINRGLAGSRSAS